MKKKDVGFHGDLGTETSVQSTMSKFKLVFYVTLISVIVGSVMALVGFMSAFDKVFHFHVSWWTGALAYVLTLWVSGWAVAKMRMMHMHYSKEYPDTYDMFAGLKISKNIRFIALFGFVFSLLAIYVAILPFAEMKA